MALSERSSQPGQISDILSQSAEIQADSALKETCQRTCKCGTICAFHLATKLWIYLFVNL